MDLPRQGSATAAAWDALQRIVDPDLRASPMDLEMIRAVTVDGVTATVELVLTLPACPLAAWLAEQVRQAVLLLPGIQAVDVRIVDAPWRWRRTRTNTVRTRLLRTHCRGIPARRPRPILPLDKHWKGGSDDPS